MSDVRLFNTADGGEIEYINGVATMSDGLEAAAYLSLFGGNEDDSGQRADDRKQWWGNLSETDPARRYRSATQNALQAMPATTGNLLRVQDAALSDLDWMKDALAAQVAVLVTMPALNTIKIDVSILVNEELLPFSFTKEWGKAA